MSSNYRFERKFYISALNRYEIETLIKLHPSMFREIYYQRYVNNLYFDSLDMTNYYANVDGVTDRSKVRIRWYGELFGDIARPTLEIKIRKGLIGTKESFPLPRFSMNDGFSGDLIHEVIGSSAIPKLLKMKLSTLRYTLLNRYNRRYYESADKHYRLTIDTEMEFYKLNFQNNSFLNRSVDSANTILELKYNYNKDKDADRITNYFPFRMTKSSKYVSGLEQLRLG